MSTSAPAPGAPGAPPHWTSSRKTGVGTDRGLTSRVWFTLGDGILNEIYYPRVDRAAVRDMGMIVTDGHSFFSEEKADTDSAVSWIAEGVPGFRLANTCREKRYEIRKIVLTDPRRHVLLQHTRFTPGKGRLSDYHLYVLLAPHLDNEGTGNTAWVGDFKGVPMLLAERQRTGLALACSTPWLLRSAGYVGTSDGWQDLNAHKRMTWAYSRAENGNVALSGEIDLNRGTEFVLALGFGRNAAEAAHRARLSLLHGFDSAREQFERQWARWQGSLLPLAPSDKSFSTPYRASTAVLASHESKDFPGGTIASLSFPWGASHGDGDPGGYHLVWPRDAYESSGAMLAAGAADEVARTLDFFQATQEADGHWPQNMWLDGRPYWNGVQLDETAASVLMLDLAHRDGLLNDAAISRLWPMVRSAASYIVRTGPSTPQDRWEEDAGYTPYTLGATIAALLIAADLAAENQQGDLAVYLRQTADAWNASVEEWLYVKGTKLAHRAGVPGHYVHVAPSRTKETPLEQQTVRLKNQAVPGAEIRASDLISTDALALVRFGLRAPDDPRIVNTVRVIDAVLKVETSRGPCWHRYNHDGYGEHADGRPFDGTGIGRAWPLFGG